MTQHSKGIGFARHAAGAAFGAALCVLSLTALAQTFPDKPVKLVVTYPPGGSSDLMARIMGQKLNQVWGQPVVIESKPGANGSIGTEYAARQPADGYTFLIGNLQAMSVNPLLNKVPYSIEKDFIPISLTTTGPNILVVPAASPFKTLGELVSAARAKPGTINFATSGPGSLSHLAAELMMRQANIKMAHIPYKGGGQAIIDVIAGQVQLFVSDALPVVQHLKSGKVRPLAITSAKRSPLFPDIPTFAEAGLQGLVVVNWWGAFLPAGTPQPVVNSYQQALSKIMVDADLKDRFAGLGVEAHVTTQDEFRTFMANEKAMYTKLISDNGIKGEQ